MPIKLRNTQTQYGLVGRLLHWISVTLLVTLVVTANRFEDLQESIGKNELIMQHASWGLLLLSVMLLRLCWRNTNLNPIPSYRLTNWQKFAAIFLHRLIYFVLITQSLIGLCYLYFSELGLSFFSFFKILISIRHDEFLSKISKNIHYILSIAIYPLFAIHISAALYHQLFGVLDHDA